MSRGGGPNGVPWALTSGRGRGGVSQARGRGRQERCLVSAGLTCWHQIAGTRGPRTRGTGEIDPQRQAARKQNPQSYTHNAHPADSLHQPGSRLPRGLQVEADPWLWAHGDPEQLQRSRAAGLLSGDLELITEHNGKGLGVCRAAALGVRRGWDVREKLHLQTLRLPPRWEPGPLRSLGGSPPAAALLAPLCPPPMPRFLSSWGLFSTSRSPVLSEGA